MAGGVGGTADTADNFSSADATFFLRRTGSTYNLQSRPESARRDLGAQLEVIGKGVGMPRKLDGIDLMRRRPELADTFGGTLQDSCRAANVAPLNVGDTYGKLRQTLPERPFAIGCTLPGRLQYLVGVEGQAGIQQVLRVAQVSLRRQVEVVGNAGYARAPVRLRSPQRVPWPAVAGPSSLIAIALRHLAMVALPTGTANQRREVRPSPVSRDSSAHHRRRQDLPESLR